MSHCKKLHIGEDNLIEWDEMKNSADDTYVNDASVSFTLKNADDSVVAGASNVSMPYIASSNGKYQGTLEDSVILTRGTRYYLEITATGSIDGFRRIACVAVYHEDD